VLTVLHCVALAYLLHCIIWLLAHVCSYALDHAELKFEEPMEQAQVEEFTNLELDQGKPWCRLLVFYFKSYFIFYYDYALSLWELYGTVVALRLTFMFILVNPISLWLTVSDAMLR
jgi:hypothetical protein